MSLPMLLKKRQTTIEVRPRAEFLVPSEAIKVPQPINKKTNIILSLSEEEIELRIR